MGELLDDVFRREWNEDRAAPAEQSSMETHAKAVKVEQRQRVDEDIARRPAPDLERTASLGKKVAMVEHRAFGAAGGPRRVEDGGGALGTEARHRRCIATGELCERDDLDAELVDDHSARRVRNGEQRVRVAEDVLCFGGVVIGVHHHSACARTQHAEVSLHPLERVGGVDGDPVSSLDAARLQAARDGLGLDPQLIARQLPIAGAEHDLLARFEQLLSQVAGAKFPP